VSAADLPLAIHERPAASEARALLVLHHGRGSDELDLLPLADLIDPERELHVVSARAPGRLAGHPGYHWYVVRRVGHPDPESFAASTAALAELHDRLWERTGIGPERTVLGGFSMGAVMSYAVGLGPGRPAPAGILALSGFVPTVPDWSPELTDREGLPVFIGHGSADPVIGVEFARRARRLLEDDGLDVDYHESPVGHQIDPRTLALVPAWLDRTLERSGSSR
jgi:phospholipase/carboxylesterase